MPNSSQLRIVDLRDTIAVVLAAGLGKRMGGEMPKVLAELRGKPLVNWVVEAIQAAGISRIIVVIGHKGELVQQALAGVEVEFVWQRKLLGTAHAVMQARSQLESHTGEVIVFLGDVPLIQTETVNQVVGLHRDKIAAATILSADLPDPSGYGRIVRQADGMVERIVEDRDADDKIRSIKEINSGLICFSTPELLSALNEVSDDNAQGEYYLTDVAEIFRARGLPVAAWKADDPIEIAGVNSPEQLAVLEEAAARQETPGQ
ncbi:MAG: NTP transferase domain-containing protein [candidate division Zixibacteria bacterium]|nr:NTP transferase domain-containing protein [candidate division Zixibacteria bacterium]